MSSNLVSVFVVSIRESSFLPFPTLYFCFSCFFEVASFVARLNCGDIAFFLMRDIPRHTVTFRVTTAGKTEKSELPGDGAIRVRIIGAEVSSFDPSGQVVVLWLHPPGAGSHQVMGLPLQSVTMTDQFFKLILQGSRSEIQTFKLANPIELPP